MLTQCAARCCSVQRAARRSVFCAKTPFMLLLRAARCCSVQRAARRFWVHAAAARCTTLQRTVPIDAARCTDTRMACFCCCSALHGGSCCSSALHGEAAHCTGKQRTARGSSAQFCCGKTPCLYQPPKTLHKSMKALKYSSTILHTNGILILSTI